RRERAAPRTFPPGMAPRISGIGRVGRCDAETVTVQSATPGISSTISSEGGTPTMWRIIGLFVLVLAFPAVVSAHFLGYDSVDGSGEIQWKSTTKYTSVRDDAIANWNAVGSVDIEPDTGWTNSDLTFEDANRSDVTWAGLYEHNSIGEDYITFNVFYMDSYP